MPTQRQRFERLLATHEPRVRNAFLEAVAELRDKIVIRDIAEALERGDVNGAIEAMRIEPAAFRALERSIEAAYDAGGSDAAAMISNLREPGGRRLVIRFDVRNPRAEQWLRNESSGLVSGIVGDQRAAIRAGLETGLREGRNPRSVALDIVGRVQRGSNRRSGGIIGLTSQQESAVARARDDLLSGDPSRMKSYLNRQRRDRRFDRTVAKAIREGRALDRVTVNRIAGRYGDRLLQLRGEAIARSEMLSALQASKLEAFRQAVDSGQVSRETIKRTWRTAGDGRVRDTHNGMNGQTVLGLDAPFISPSGVRLMHPGDGPAEESINCRCNQEIRIDFLAGVE